ncbi:D-sedoheptulose-7-phosphate isomerase [Pandoraea sputorum]|uniref:Phosphoheptose isomerase n=1 Tax=Pandoraea sputorum TaxID=93222 RepID=A0A239SYB4_9BURK|nr:SIS domain-containing protein [Pandoraea sputorum]AJC15326.1 phosphoheptose isomerase [Pandoraea sputorum]SNU90229.1 Phosphoheptose isomerase 1 [Pandoraea sputorum]VVE35066.1 phosphoheptose isomerase [Pandoraea sputorum]VVE84404.1 phosphoheptose isomerase [Pandoraea sputorum]
MSTSFTKAVEAHLTVIQSLPAITSDVETAARVCAEAIARGGRILFCGNGGSASDSQHLAGELVGRLKGNRRPLAAHALGADSAVVTCIANDFGYDEVFARQVEGIGREGDVLIAISTSGNSANVVRAVECANEMGIVTIGLLGGSGGKLLDMVTHALCISVTTDTARIQEAHILIGHVICADIETRLGLA